MVDLVGGSDNTSHPLVWNKYVRRHGRPDEFRLRSPSRIYADGVSSSRLTAPHCGKEFAADGTRLDNAAQHHETENAVS